MALRLADQLLERHSRGTLADPAVWIFESEGFRARSGPFSALAVLADWDANAAGFLVRELAVTAGAHRIARRRRFPRRQSSRDAPGQRPASRRGLVPAVVARRPVLAADGRVGGVILDLFEP